MLEPGQDDTAKFLADHKVHVIASLPCYSPKNVNLQRGSGVFQRRYENPNMCTILCIFWQISTILELSLWPLCMSSRAFDSTKISRNAEICENNIE